MRGRLNFSTALAVVLSWEKVLCFTPSNNVLLPSDVAFLSGLQHHEKRARRNINVSVQVQLQGPSPSSQLFSSVLPNDEKPSVVIDDEASQKQEIAKVNKIQPFLFLLCFLFL
jgi:hypothetical protein